MAMYQPLDVVPMDWRTLYPNLGTAYAALDRGAKHHADKPWVFRAQPQGGGYWAVIVRHNRTNAFVGYLYEPPATDVDAALAARKLEDQP